MMRVKFVTILLMLGMSTFVPLLMAQEVPATDAKKAPVIDAKKAPATDAKKAPATDAKKVPATDAKKAPATDAKKVPATDAKKAPATDAKKAPATDAKKVPATDAKKVPATDAKKAPATDAKKAPATDAKKVMIPATPMHVVEKIDISILGKSVKDLFNAGNLKSAQEVAQNILSVEPQHQRAQQYLQLITAKLRAKEALSASVGDTNLVAINENTIAVVSFVNTGDDKSLDPLQKALAEMVITDLAQVTRLTIIERMQMQALMTEMALGMSGLLKETSVIKIGSLLDAAKVVNGSFKNTNDGLSMDAGVANAKDGGVKAVSALTGKREDLFKLQKDMVFALIKEMGIVLTEDERKKIEIIPTENVLALLAFGKALDAEDRGDFDAAATYMQEAANADPHYGISQVADDMTPVFTESAPVAVVEDILTEEVVPEEVTKTTNTAVRFQVLNNVNSGFMPEAQILPMGTAIAPVAETIERNSYIDSKGLAYDGGTKAVTIKVPIPNIGFKAAGGVQ